MNRAHAVRTDATEHGVRVRLWIDDVEGRHLTVAELELPGGFLVGWLRAVDRESQKAQQYQLDFD
jgi:hypothetical protein